MPWHHRLRAAIRIRASRSARAQAGHPGRGGLRAGAGGAGRHPPRALGRLRALGKRPPPLHFRISCRRDRGAAGRPPRAGRAAAPHPRGMDGGRRVGLRPGHRRPDIGHPRGLDDLGLRPGTAPAHARAAAGRTGAVHAHDRRAAARGGRRRGLPAHRHRDRRHPHHDQMDDESLAAAQGRGWIAPPVAAGIGASVFTAPVLAYHFGQIPLLSLPSSILLTPLVATAVPGVIATIVMDILHIPGAAIAGAGSEGPPARRDRDRRRPRRPSLDRGCWSRPAKPRSSRRAPSCRFSSRTPRGARGRRSGPASRPSVR